MRSGRVTAISIAELLTTEGFSTDPSGIVENTSAEALNHALPGGIPELAVKEAQFLLRHILEAATGYRSGNAVDALPGEPKPEYDPIFRSVSSRITSKAKELKCSDRAVWKYYENYKARGIYGLVDGRAVRTQLSGQKHIVTQAIDKVVAALLNKSNLPIKRIVSLVENQIKATEGLPDKFVLPSRSTLRRSIFTREDAKRLLKSSKSRRNAANRPGKAYTRFHATRPGEVVLIDSTPLDAFALDSTTHQWKSIHLTIALDLYTRSIVGWRFSGDPKAVDAALLLADIISPKRSREWFGDALAKPFVGIPLSIVTRLSQPEEVEEQGYLVNIPFVHPESVLIDQGKVFISETFCMACSHLGINVMLARPYTPTDKAQVERMFKSIRESFVMGLPGYKGPDVYSRGASVEKEAHYYLHEIDDLFREWVTTYWQERQHDGLFLSCVPTLELTPNQMMAEGIARAGFMHVLPDKDMYYQLLPVVWRKINHYGVEVDHLRYDSIALDPWRNLPSKFTDPVNGKWPFRQDPRDKSILIFFDQDLKTWHEIPWTGANNKHRPFDAKTLTFAKDQAFLRLGHPPEAKDVESVLNELLERMGNISTADRKERHILGQAMMNASRADSDRRKSVGKRVAQNPSGAARNEPTTAPKEFDYLASGSFAVEPLLIQEAVDDVIDDSEDENAAAGDEMCETTAPIFSIKSIDEALEDDNDDLIY